MSKAQTGVNVSFWVDTPTNARLEKFAHKQRTNKSTLIRDALVFYMENVTHTAKANKQQAVNQAPRPLVELDWS